MQTTTQLIQKQKATIWKLQDYSPTENDEEEQNSVNNTVVTEKRIIIAKKNQIIYTLQECQKIPHKMPNTI